MTSRAQRVFGLLIVRNEVDIVRLCAIHHLATACDELLVVDNGSTDRTRTALQRLAKKLPLKWTAENGPYLQQKFYTGLAEDARLAGADWVLPLDADEFWVGPRDLRQHFGELGDAGAIRVPRVEFVQRRSQLRPSPRSVTTMTMRIERPEQGVDAIERFTRAKASIFQVQPQPKLAFRVSPDLIINRGAHTGRGLAGPIIDATDVTIFHAPLRSRVDMNRKAEHGRRLLEAGAKPDEGVQSRFWAAEDAAGRLDEAWAASSERDGALNVYGEQVELLSDPRLAGVLEPWIRTPRVQILARLLGRSF